MNLFREAEGFKSVCIAGMSKNAGKTTVLNAFLDAFHAHGVGVAVTSIGRDGESNDVVFDVAKPEVFLKKGDIAATAKGLLPLCTVTREILCATGFPTPLGEVVVFRALSDGFVQIAGPSIVAQLAELKKIFFGLGARIVFFDGALGRKSLCSPEVADAAVLASGASLSADMDFTVAETAFAVRLLQSDALNPDTAARLEKAEAACALTENGIVPLDKSVKPAENTRLIFVPGALTNERKWAMDTAAELSVPLVVENGANVLADRSAAEKFFADGGKMLQLKKVALLAVAVNPFSAFGYEYDAATFEKKMRDAVNVPVLNVKNIKVTK